MKHHFGDMLDRSGGHWNFVPNRERYAYHMPEWTSGQKSISIATISKDDTDWKLIGTFPNLEELTLHSPSQDQLAFVNSLWRLKRLRITHARPKNLEFLARLQNLEEVILEYVSGFDDLSPLGELAGLRALHIENVRRVTDFSGLKTASSLRYLSIDGTIDWKQPVANFDFLQDLRQLEFLRLAWIRSLTTAPALLPLTKLKHLKKLKILRDLFGLEDYALLRAAFPTVEGAAFEAYKREVYSWIPLAPDDIRSRLSDEQLKASHPEVFIRFDGHRQLPNPNDVWFDLLGFKAGRIKSTDRKVEAKCAAYNERFENMIQEARAQLTKR